MSFLAVPLAIYLQTGPAGASILLLVLLLLLTGSFILSVFFRGLPELSLSVLECAVLLIVILRALPVISLSFGMPSEHVEGIAAKALQDSVQREYRSVGFRAELIASSDGSMLASSSGTIYVISEQADITAGDYLYLLGTVSGPVFYADGVHILSRSHFSRIRIELRGFIREKFMRLGDAGELSLRLLLGTGEMGSYQYGDNARLSGLAHVIALSGMHLSVLAMIISKLFFFLPKTMKDWITAIFLLFFTFLSGMRPSLFRALIYRMALKATGNSNDSFALSALFLFGLFPESVSDLGAQYSFIALGGIFFLSSSADEGIRAIVPIPYAVSSSVASSIAALVFSVPLTIMTFGSYTIGSLFTTLPATIMITVYMGISLAVLFFPFLSPVLDFFFDIISAFFSFAASCPQADDLVPYIAVLTSGIVFYAIGSLRKRRIAKNVILKVC